MTKSSFINSRILLLALTVLAGCERSRDSAQAPKKAVSSRLEFSQGIGAAYTAIAKAYGGFAASLQPFLDSKGGDRQRVRKSYTELRDSVEKAKAYLGALNPPAGKDCRTLVETFSKYVGVHERAVKTGFGEVVHKIEADKPDPDLALEISISFLAYNKLEKEAREAFLRAVEVFDQQRSQ